MIFRLLLHVTETKRYANSRVAGELRRHDFMWHHFNDVTILTLRHDAQLATKPTHGSVQRRQAICSDPLRLYRDVHSLWDRKHKCVSFDLLISSICDFNLKSAAFRHTKWQSVHSIPMKMPLNITGLDIWLFNIGFGNWRRGNKPLPQYALTMFCEPIWRHSVIMSYHYRRN